MPGDVLSGNGKTYPDTNHTSHDSQMEISECCATFQSDGIFNWDTKTQGNILGAFFYGYITTQIISGILAQKFGGKLTMLFGVSWSAALTLLTPVLTTAGGFPAIFTIRLLEGIGQVRYIVSCRLFSYS